MEGMSYVEHLRTLGLSNLKRSLRGNLFSVYDIWNGSKLSQGRFRFDIRKHFFTERVVQHWSRLARGKVDSPSLFVLKRYLDNSLNNML